MDQNRREFFRNVGSKTAGIAAVSVAPVTAHLAALSDDIQKVAGNLNNKLTQQKVELTKQLGTLNNRLDSVMVNAAFQQAQLTLIFFLLLLSFAIDAGMTFTVAATAI